MSTYGPSIFEQAIQHHDRATCRRENCGRCARPAASKAPPIPTRGPNGGIGPHDAQTPPEPPDRTVHAIGLPQHPDPATIASALEGMAKALRQHGYQAIAQTSILAAKGYSACTMGDGRRGGDTTSSTERLGLETGPWDAADYAYASTLRTAWQVSLLGSSMTLGAVAHATDQDPMPAGQGECRACARTCKPTREKPGDRLRSGLCPTCYRAWRRYADAGGPLLWSAWVAKRRESMTERDPAGNVVKIHTPEPDHDLDLSRERAS